MSSVSLVLSPVTSSLPVLVNSSPPAPSSLTCEMVLTLPEVASSRPALVSVPLSMVAVLSSSVGATAPRRRLGVDLNNAARVVEHVGVERQLGLSPVTSSLPVLVNSSPPAPSSLTCEMVLTLPEVASSRPALVSVPLSMVAVLSSSVGANAPPPHSWRRSEQCRSSCRARRCRASAWCCRRSPAACRCW